MRPPASPADAAPPERRSPRPLDLRRFTPALITLLAQRIVTSASAEYRPRFGVGVTDWRVMALLAAEPWLAPARIAQATGLDKAAVSRSLGILRERGLVEPDSAAKRGGVALTAEGLALHDRLAEVALERERRLLEGFSPQERAQLAAMLRRMLDATGG